MYCFAFLLLLNVLSTTTAENPCELEHSVDITDGSQDENGYITKSNVTYASGNYFSHEGSIRGCNCGSTKCIRKCCALGQYINDNKTCDYTTAPFNFTDIATADAQTYSIITGRCNGQSILLDPENNTDDSFRISVDGSLFWPSAEVSYGVDKYCVDYVASQKSILKAIVCVDDDFRSAYYSTGMIISMPFLLITFLVYATLPDRNIHGKALMSYVMSLLMAYIFLVSILLKSDYTPLPCQILAYVCYFFFLASFFWMNVMCIDIWWTFSGMRGIAGSKRKTKKRFILFSFYAWGVPLIFLIILATINSTLDDSSMFHPQVAVGKCWIKDGLPLLIYFYGAMALIIIFNVVLFILTALKILQAKRETAMLKREDSKRHSYENEKQRFNLYLKLLLAMGLNWSMEVISWVFEWKVQSVPRSVWIITDTCNALYGVFIFFIFVFKKNIWNHIQRRYYNFTGRSIMAQNLANSLSNPTRTTSQMSQEKFSMTDATPLPNMNHN